jgi:hypothetical protein
MSFPTFAVPPRGEFLRDALGNPLPDESLLVLKHIDRLERENAALREENRKAHDMACEDAVERYRLNGENAALREALQSAENGLRHALMIEPLDPFKRGKIISEALDSVRAAIDAARAKEAKP